VVVERTTHLIRKYSSSLSIALWIASDRTALIFRTVGACPGGNHTTRRPPEERSIRTFPPAEPRRTAQLATQRAARELSRAACAMNCRDCGGRFRFRSSIVRRITRLSDLFDSCFLNSGLHFLHRHLSITSTSTANLRARPRRRTRRVRIGPDVQAIFCRRRHQVRGSPLPKTRPRRKFGLRL
jgi:hypothetical protein